VSFIDKCRECAFGVGDMSSVEVVHVSSIGKC
jgi:hypothetical protein